MARLSLFAIDTKTRPVTGSDPYTASCDLAYAVPNIASMPITSPVERISGPSTVSTPAPVASLNRPNGSTASLTATGESSGRVPPSPSAGQHARGAQRADRRAEHHQRGRLGERHGGRLGHERHGPRRARVRLEHVQHPGRERVLHVEQPAHPDAAGDLVRRLPDRRDVPAAQGDRRQRARRVAGVDPGLLDVLHHAAEVQLRPVVEGVDVDLDRVVEEPVDQHRMVGRGGRRRAVHVGPQRLLVVDDLHAAPAEHVRRPHQHRVADLARRRPPPPPRTARPRRAARSGPPRRAPTRTRRGPRRGGSRPATCRRSAPPPLRGPRASPSGVCPPSCTITPATGPAACSACTTSSTSSRVSGSKYSREEVS